MDPSGINLKLSYESLNEKLREEMIVVAGHPFLAGGGRVAVLTGVVTLVLPPGLSTRAIISFESLLFTFLSLSQTSP